MVSGPGRNEVSCFRNMAAPPLLSERLAAISDASREALKGVDLGLGYEENFRAFCVEKMD